MIFFCYYNFFEKLAFHKTFMDGEQQSSNEEEITLYHNVNIRSSFLRYVE